MGIFSWIILGLVAGALGKLFMPGDDPGGILMTMVLGIVGALLGGFIATLIGFGTVNGFNLGSLVIAILGSMLLLFIYRQTKGRKTTSA